MNKKITNWLEENWFKISLILVIILISFLTLYWFQIHPNQIRKQCAAEAIETKNLFDYLDIENHFNEKKYEHCLTKEGLR